jgi:ADP-ribose pyrophosphatase YjhB (NUDIX family)
MSSPATHFKHCPRCGHVRENPGAEPLFRCASCGFLYHFNPAIAVAGFLLDSTSRILLIRRAKEPAKGKLAIPGGFVDIGETAEEALRREIREEVNLTVGPLQYLCSQLNTYHYQEVTYPVLDFFFVAPAEHAERAAALDGVAGFFWSDPAAINPDEIGFPSIRKGLECFLAKRK